MNAALHTRSQPIKLTVSHSGKRGGGKSRAKNFSKVTGDKRMKKGSVTLMYDLSGKRERKDGRRKSHIRINADAFSSK